MITVQQRVNKAFTDRLDRDPTWLALTASEYRNRPPVAVLSDMFERVGVRFGATRTGQIREAWNRGFENLAWQIRTILRANHDQRAPAPKLRQVELEVARIIQYELYGCNVGPKVARLMMIWGHNDILGEDFRHVVPVDSRWLTALAAGATSAVAIDPRALAREDRYREIEDEICRAAYDLDVLPFEADKAVFRGSQPV